MGATLVEKITVVPLLFCVIGRVLLSIPLYPFRGTDGAPDIVEQISSTLFRSVFGYLSVGQLQ